MTLPTQPEQLAALTIKERLYWWVRAELALQRGDLVGAANIINGLLVAAQVGAEEPTAVVARLWLLRARLEMAQAQPAFARATLQLARQAAIAQGGRPILWRVETLFGQLAAQRGESQLEEAQVAAARTLIETLAATLPTAAQRDRFLDYARAHLPTPQSITPLRAAKAIFAGLTEREREVAALIAQGKSDRAIAETLVVSKRTASTHVTNILNKLGFSSRSQIAAWAVEKGIR